MEEWRSIKGFPGYKVSNLGHVLSHQKGDLFGHILKPSRGNKAKRALVTLYRDGKQYYRLVARLVCQAFHGDPLPRQQAAHQDGDVFNDRADNLEWKYPVGNCADRDRHGRTARGERHYAAQFTDAQVSQIKAAYREAKKAGRAYGIVVALAKKHNAKISAIETIVYERKWRHVA